MNARAAVAVTTVATPQPSGIVLQRQCACGNRTRGGAECETCADKKKLLQRKPTGSTGGSGAGEIPPLVHDVLRSPGRPLDTTTRAFMERRFNRDFAHVRIHTDARAAESASAVNALAYTVGRDVVFGAGQYAPGADAGRRLIAHELTHTLQQSGSPSFATAALGVSDPTDAGEREAQQTADAVLAGRFAPAPTRTMPQLQRQDRGGANTGSTDADTGPGPYDGCGSYREPVERARADAARLAGHAADVLDPANVAQAAPLLAAHFHLDPSQPQSGADIETVRAQFARMQQALSSSIRIVCRSAPVPGTGAARPQFPVYDGCRGEKRRGRDADSPSCAAGNATAVVNLCDTGLLEMSNPLTKTLLHEFAHVACNGSPAIRSGGSNGGEVYYDGSRLPGNEMAVLVNADSYAWFALQADRIAAAASSASAATAASGSAKPGHAGWGVLTGVGGAVAVAGGIGLGYGIQNKNGAGIGLGIAGLALGGVGIGVGIAGLLGAFDPSAPAQQQAQPPAPSAPPRTAPATLAELSAMPAWQLAQLPESAFAGAGTGGTAEAAGPRLEDYARAWRMVRCIRDFHHLTVDPETVGQVGRNPTDAEWAVLRSTLSQILAHANVGAMVQGPGGRGDIGTPPLANKVRIVSGLNWGIKRFQLESMIMPVGSGADRFVRQWWAEARCGIQPGASPQIVDQERRMAMFSEQALGARAGNGGFYYPPDDTIYIDEGMAGALMGTTAPSGMTPADARVTAGHEMTHLVGGREQTRRAFMNYFQGDDHWICYWSAFEEGMAEITARDAVAGGQPGSGRGYEAFVQLMRPIMQALGEERVRRAYFTGTPDREIFERVRQGLPGHMDPTLPPVCADLRQGGRP